MPSLGRVVVVSFVLGCLILGAGCGKIRKKKPMAYLPSQETVEQFGDGRFELATTTQGTILRDLKTHRTLIARVVGWVEDNGRLYFKNKDDAYLVLDPDADTWDVYASLDDVPEDDRDAASRVTRQATFVPHGGL